MEFGFPGLGNAAWKEKVDGWKMKKERNVASDRDDGWKMKQGRNIASVTTSQTASERGCDMDASTDVLIDDSLL